ncbi:MAG: hypothetical protein IPP84_14730 [Propionivibrio sp.]|uniref:hypothetical protein n=1 Tax=Propionivibrio sp. TaxID=2212460 RepID=UPI0025EA5DDC|nr:hypothetical protein [Propionivibrio sp.]MBL0209138.1 hypothetical protein [Propionivibrio sp.]
MPDQDVLLKPTIQEKLPVQGVAGKRQDRKSQQEKWEDQDAADDRYGKNDGPQQAR